MSQTRLLALAFLAALLATAFSAPLPGLWWQWLLCAAILLCATAVSSNNDDKENEQ